MMVKESSGISLVIFLLIFLSESLVHGQARDSISSDQLKISLNVKVSPEIIAPRDSIKFSLEYKNNTHDTLYFLPSHQFLYLTTCYEKEHPEPVRAWITHEGDSVLFFSSIFGRVEPTIYLFWDDEKLRPIRKREIIAEYTRLLPRQTHEVIFDLPYLIFHHLGKIELCLYNNNTCYPDVKSTALLMLLPEHQIVDEVIKSNSFRLTFTDE